MTTNYIIPKNKNSIVITYLPDDDLTWAKSVQTKYPRINFIYFQITQLSAKILASRGFNTVPAIQYWPRGFQSYSVQGKLDSETLERDIAELKF